MQKSKVKREKFPLNINCRINFLSSSANKSCKEVNKVTAASLKVKSLNYSEFSVVMQVLVEIFLLFEFISSLYLFI